MGVLRLFGVFVFFRVLGFRGYLDPKEPTVLGFLVVISFLKSSKR